MNRVIYVPGIADDIGHVQGALVHLWRLRGVRGVMHVMPWAGPSDYSASAERLLQRIDALTANGQPVFLVGASAGATAVINAYEARRDKVAGVLLICPKVNDSTNIGSKILKKNPSFLTAMRQEEINQAQLTAADRQRMAIFISPRDGAVTKVDSFIAGVKTHRLPPLPHSIAILYTLSLGFGQLKAELERISRQS